MRNDNQASWFLFKDIFNSWQRLADTVVIHHFATKHRHIVIGPQKNPLAREVDVFNRFFLKTHHYHLIVCQTCVCLSKCMVTLDHSVYKQIANEIIRWNQILKTTYSVPLTVS